MKYNKSEIMKNAWNVFKKNNGKITFGEALHRAWNAVKAYAVNAERIALAKAKDGIEEVTKTWAEWKKLGYEVRHGEKALFGVDLIYATKGDGEIYKARFFGFSQVEAVA